MEADPCSPPHLGDPDGPDVLTVASGAITRAPQPRQYTPQALRADTTVDGVRGWGRSA